MTPGTRIGPYEVVSSLGAGGMGEVYRATDTTLGRQVAIKILPPVFASDPERLARFEREAKTLASLNHPSIAAIYGFERSPDTQALVMELVEGEDLSQRIGRGAIPPEEALPIARQIADALEAAHDQGIIHRDLKPANIKVRSDGMVKVLDFGLAKLADPAATTSSDANLTMSPTVSPLSLHATMAGVILGTAAYMSPEQARGKAVDKRADIWAFGCVLFEMLTGEKPFQGADLTDTLASIVKDQPDLSKAPAAVRPLLARCLEKDPRKRLRDIGDAMSLVSLADEPRVGESGSAPTRGRWITYGGWTIAATLVVALFAALWWRRGPAVAPDPPLVRFQIERSPDVYNRTARNFAVSPDGLLLAYYAAGSDGPQTLVVRTLATGEVRAVARSATTIPTRDSIFWSPDSRRLVRGTAAGADVFDLSSNTVQPLCDCRYLGGTWNQDGTILLGAAGPQGISRLSVDDRKPTEITKVDASRGEHDTWPAFLPDGRRFLFTRSTSAEGDEVTYVGTLDGDAPKRIVAGSRRVFIPAAGGPGGAIGRGPYLLGIDAAGLVAQPFDPDTLQVTGPAVTLVAGAAALSASANGVLAASEFGTRPRTVPTWFDRNGSARGQIGQPAIVEGLALSRDGRKLARSESENGPTGPASTVWSEDIATGARTRLTFSGGSTPVWSPTATTLAFSSVRNGVALPYQKAADGTGGEVPLFAYDAPAWVNDWSRDGQWVIFSSPARENVNDLWAVSVAAGGEHKAVPYLVEPRIQQQAQFSPDGRFVAYGSDQSGTFEIYVQPFPKASDGKWMVSSGGGVEPRWSADGKELFYFSGQTLMAVPVSLRPTFSPGVPKKLFDAPIRPGYTQDSHRWQIAPDGRFLLLADVGNTQTPLDVIVNWPALLTRRADGGGPGK